MSDRLYRPKVAMPVDGWSFPINDIGHLLEINGILFSGDGRAYLCLMPDAKFSPIEVVYPLNAEYWEAVIEASDNPQYLDATRKVWLRKAQRLISGQVQQQIWARDGFQCMYCHRKMGEVQLTVDHFWPLEMGGKDEPGNYLSACRKCNKEKGKINPETWCAERGLNFDSYVFYLEKQQ